LLDDVRKRFTQVMSKIAGADDQDVFVA